MLLKVSTFMWKQSQMMTWEGLMAKKVIIVSVSVLFLALVALFLHDNLGNILGSQFPSGQNDLMISKSYMDTRTLIYELPNDEGRAEEVRRIEKARDNFLSKLHIKVEVIDATKLDDSTLKNKLSALRGDFALYTTIGSRLFNATTQPLHIPIDGGALHWNGVKAPVSDLRLVLVGKNPYGDGHCVVHAAGSNRLLAGIMKGDGRCSYRISQGDKLLKAGDYNKDFVVGTDSISKAEAVADVNQFFSTLQRVHPDLLSKVKVEDYIKLKRQTLGDISKHLDSKGKISVGDLAYSLYYAAAFFHDGHTSVEWQFQPTESKMRFPPFLLGYDNGRIVIVTSSVKNLEGLEVLSVNGKPVREFLSPILDRCSGETLAFKTVRFTSKQTFWYSFSNLCGSAESLSLELRDAQGKQSARKIETVSLSDFQKLKDSRMERIRRQATQGAQVRFLDSDKIAYFVYPAFNNSRDEMKRVKDVFEQVKAKGSQDLIIDIRGNGGGDSSMGELILSYLYGEKFAPFSRIREKLSREIVSTAYPKALEKYMGVRDASKYFVYYQKLADLEGVIVDRDMVEKSATKPRAFYHGRVFLLVDNATFSSATDFAVMFRDYRVGRILGYETGGVPNSFGDLYPFELKNSGIRCNVSWKQFICPKPRPGDDMHGVLPDVPMSVELLRAYQKEADPVLAFTLDHMKKTRQKPSEK